jgi:hypothetical protein
MALGMLIHDFWFSRAAEPPLRVVLLAQPAQMASSGTYLLRHQDRSPL